LQVVDYVVDNESQVADSEATTNSRVTAQSGHFPAFPLFHFPPQVLTHRYTMHLNEFSSGVAVHLCNCNCNWHFHTQRSKL